MREKGSKYKLKKCFIFKDFFQFVLGNFHKNSPESSLLILLSQNWKMWM